MHRPVARSSRTWTLAGATLVLVAAGGLLAAASDGPPSPPEPAPDPLVALGHEVTGGAAPGYVDSSLCGLCHQGRYLSYQDVGMARSFYSPERVASGERRIEDFSAPPFHQEDSDLHYEIRPAPEGDGLVFRRWREDEKGGREHELELPVAWVLGSGNHSRIYLHRNPAGELYQLPLAWYSQVPADDGEGVGAWRMAPGYENAEHPGVHRQIRRECMFCHNGYPDVPESNDDFAADHLFPAELPEGTGCQRCHGPGAEHVRRVLSPDAAAETVREAIVNPGRLEPELRDSVCYECHMEPSIAFPGMRRFGRDSYSFRPGQPLSEFRVDFDIEEVGRAPGDRFEINHHPYRLEQSPCFVASRAAGADLPEGAEPLSCLTCHDPHVKVPPERRIEHYAAACASCHGADACGLDHAAERPVHLAGVSPADCTTCHMPARRPEDVIHVVMTDHRITRDLPGPELTAPRKEWEPKIDDVVFHHPEEAPEGALGEVYRAVAAIRSGVFDEEAVGHLDRSLEAAAAAGFDEVEPWLDLAFGQLDLDRADAATRTLARVLSRDDLSPGTRRLARERLAIAQAGLGRSEAAIELLETLLAEDPDRPVARYNLARLLLRQDERERAKAELEILLDLRPNFYAAWRSLGEIALDEGRHADAVAAYETALAWEPRDPESAEGLARARKTASTGSRR